MRMCLETYVLRKGKYDMERNRLNFGIIVRVALSLVPILFGMPTLGVVLCAFNIVMSFIAFGPLNAIVSALTATCLSMLLCGMYGEAAKLQGLFIALEAVFCSAACIYCAVVKRKFYQGVVLTACGYLLPSFISLRSEASLAGLSVADYLVKAPLEILKLQFATVEEGTQQLGIQAEFLDSVIETTSSFVVMTIPSILIICSLFVGYVIMWSVTTQLRKVPGGLNHSFSQIRLPKMAVIVLAISVIALIFSVEKDFMFIPVNLLMILLSVCFFAGVSFTEFYLRRAVKKPFLRIAIHIFIIVGISSIAAVFPFVNIFLIYALIAVIDAFFNFRKLSLDMKMRGEVNETEDTNS